MAITKTTDLFIPEVIAKEVELKLTDMLVLDGFTETDTTLQGKAGDTVTLPSFSYIGDAADVAEGAAIPTEKLTASTRTATIKKYGKGVPVTDESALSGYGNPIGEATTQLATAIKQKLDKDKKAMLSTDISTGMTVGSDTEALDDMLISKALVKFGEDVTTGNLVMPIDPEQLQGLRDNNYYIPASELAADIRVNGSMGSIHGVQFILRNNASVSFDDTTKKENFLFRDKPVRNYIKRNVMIEVERDAETQVTTIFASEIGGVFLYDESKAVKVISGSEAVEVEEA